MTEVGLLNPPNGVVNPNPLNGGVDPNPPSDDAVATSNPKTRGLLSTWASENPGQAGLLALVCTVGALALVRVAANSMTVVVDAASDVTSSGGATSGGGGTTTGGGGTTTGGGATGGEGAAAGGDGATDDAAQQGEATVSSEETTFESTTGAAATTTTTTTDVGAVSVGGGATGASTAEGVENGPCNKKCGSGLVCCSNICVKGVKAPGALVAQCPEACRGNAGWPLGTCGLEWGKTIGSTCDKCKWSDRNESSCKNCTRDSSPKTAEPASTPCTVWNYGCESGWTHDGALLCRKSTPVDGPCQKYETKQSCPNGETLYMSGCYAGKTSNPLNRKRTASISTKCVKNSTVTRTETKGASKKDCKTTLTNCPALYTLINGKCTHQTERLCDGGYTMAMTPDAGNKCVRKGECAEGWRKHTSSAEHCVP